MDSPEGKEVYNKRFGIIEPVFGNFMVQKGLRRISLRGKMKTNIQWLLGCMVHNLEKVGTKGFERK
ncbi:MAG: transposase [Candidatus Riflebacteria bacterium]|nr:transposase [Candidatus Riflebacteria bacterium]